MSAYVMHVTCMLSVSYTGEDMRVICRRGDKMCVDTCSINFRLSNGPFLVKISRLIHMPLKHAQTRLFGLSFVLA